MISQPRSMAGWNFKTWLSRNKGGLKTLVSGLLAVLGAWAATIALPVWAIPVPALFLGFVSRMVLDMIDFWCGSVEVP